MRMLPEMQNSFVSCSQANACLTDMPLQKQEKLVAMFPFLSSEQHRFCFLFPGHGLLDRFLFIFPTCLPPSLQDTEDALSWLESQPLKSLTDFFLEMFEYHGNRKVVYKFTDSSQSLLNDFQSQEIHDINEAIKEGNPPPKCKKMDLIKRLAGSLHIFNHIASKLLEGIQPGPPPQRITEHSVAAAEKLTAFADSQKQIATEVRILSI